MILPFFYTVLKIHNIVHLKFLVAYNQAKTFYP